MDHISFSGTIVGSSPSAGINEAVTRQISAIGGNPFAQYLTISRSSGEVTWIVGENITCSNSEGSQPVSFGPRTTYVDLFTIAVEGLPGDEVDFLLEPTSYVSCITNCTGTIPIVNCSINPSLKIIFPPLPSCSPAKKLAYGLFYDAVGIPGIRIDMQGGSPGESIQSLSGVIRIVPTMSGIPDISLSVLPWNVGLELDVKVVKNPDKSFDIFFRQKEGTSWNPPSSPIPIFGLTILGQYNLSQGAVFKCSNTLSALTTTYQGNPSSVCSLAPSSGDALLMGYSSCGSALGLSSTRYIEPNCNTGIKFTFNHTYSGVFQLKKLRLHFVFKTAQSNNPLPPQLGNLPGAPTMVYNSQIRGYEFKYEYESEAAPVQITNGQEMLFPFYLSRGCIEYFVIAAEAIPLGLAGTCALGTTVDIGHFPVCKPEVKGEVVLIGNGKAPEYTATLTSIADPGYSLSTPVNCSSVLTRYMFCPNYTKSPFKVKIQSTQPENYLCGVTTLDIAMIDKKILGLAPLNIPYGLIAADVTPPAGIDIYDKIEIKKLILGITETFPGNVPSWRYIWDGTPFSNPSEPWLNPSIYTDEATVSSGSDADFRAVKMGDVNGTCSCSNIFDRSSTDADSWATLQVKEDAIRREGRNLHIPVMLQAHESVLALQAGFYFDPTVFDFIEVIPAAEAAVTLDHFGMTKIEEGALRFAWDGTTAPLSGKTRLFTLVLQLKPGAVSPEGQVLRTAQHVLPAVAVTSEMKEKPIGWQWLDRNGRTSELQWSVTPNPASEYLHLWITGNGGEEARLRITAGNGSLLGEQSFPLQKGEQYFQVPVTDLPPGVYTISMETQGQVLQKRFVKI
jgi:hypothetical protein